MATALVNRGRAVITAALVGLGATSPKYVHWGTGTNGTPATATNLTTKSTEEGRATGTASQVTGTTTNDTFRVVGTITAVTSAKAITEVGTFESSTTSNNDLFIYSDFSVVNVAIGDSIEFTIDCRFS
jgi:hypothetical protein